MRYEYKLVHGNWVQQELEQGWEPVPNVEHIVDHALNTPSTYVFLRRRLAG